jgi:protein-S-isoprenylcysteine O-methyltransferase Ste14
MALLAVWFIAAPFTYRSRSKEGRLRRLVHTIPFGLAIYLLLTMRRHLFGYDRLYGTDWDNWIVYPALLTTVAGCLFALSARFHLGRYWSGIITLKEGHKLITTGPYRIVRHPIYTGWLAAAFGTALTAGTSVGFLCAALVAFAFVIKLRREEKLLTTEFGDEYRRFRQTVPAALIPFVY